MGTRLRTCGLGIALGSALWAAPVARAAPPVWGDCVGAREGDLVDLTEELRARVARGTEAEASCLQGRVGQGLPPAALLVLLDAIVEHPAAQVEAMIPIAWDLARHRRANVRSRALTTLAHFEGDWADRAVVLAISDRDAAVRATGHRLAAQHPSPRFEASLREAFERDEPEAGAALAACATQDLVFRLPQVREQVALSQWVRLVGALIRRPQLLTSVQRLGLVTGLATLRTPEALDELRAFVAAEVALDEPTARNLAARAVGLTQDPKRSRRPPKGRPHADKDTDTDGPETKSEHE